MSKHTFTLSRAHAIADRIRDMATAKQTEALATLSDTAIAHEPTEAQIGALRERGQRALAQIAEAGEALRTVGLIRETLAVANAKHGVTALLARIEARRQESRLLAKFTALDLLTRVSLDDVGPAFRERAATAAHPMTLRQGVSLNVVGLNALEPFRETKAALDAEINALGDEVNDLNRHTVEVELPDALARAVGL
jgi:hypothetical protein